MNSICNICGKPLEQTHVCNEVDIIIHQFEVSNTRLKSENFHLQQRISAIQSALQQRTGELIAAREDANRLANKYSYYDVYGQDEVGRFGHETCIHCDKHLDGDDGEIHTPNCPITLHNQLIKKEEKMTEPIDVTGMTEREKIEQIIINTLQKESDILQDDEIIDDKTNEEVPL